jgi:hypothetical protein
MAEAIQAHPYLSISLAFLAGQIVWLLGLLICAVIADPEHDLPDDGAAPGEHYFL